MSRGEIQNEMECTTLTSTVTDILPCGMGLGDTRGGFCMKPVGGSQRRAKPNLFYNGLTRTERIELGAVSGQFKTPLTMKLQN